METKEVTENKNVNQKIKLVKGEFTPSEATHIIIGLLDLKINFHKVQRLQNWEADHQGETSQLDSRIKELEKEKEMAKAYFTRIQGLGKNLKINGDLEINLSE